MKRSKIPQVKVKIDKKNNITLTCSHCKELITKTSVEFGMDCVNDCAKKDYEARKAADPNIAALEKILDLLRKIYSKL